ncbi:hypothetical protein QY95_01209 [Bacillus thermotolerans]|uniref:Uncharacterized protein n=1 Tax=Bacillus thermotolerans TaxID=1221996 RepID=A0A0F5I5U6_BACTR|nr:hypothetical protein QY95_01209 [Bacillus thermotolerans]
MDVRFNHIKVIILLERRVWLKALSMGADRNHFNRSLLAK